MNSERSGFQIPLKGLAAVTKDLLIGPQILPSLNSATVKTKYLKYGPLEDAFPSHNTLPPFPSHPHSSLLFWSTATGPSIVLDDLETMSSQS